MNIEIKHRYTGNVIFTADAKSIAACVLLAIAAGADLSDCDLSDCNLRGSDLSGSNLRGSDLSGSDLSDCDLSGSNLRGSNLSDCNLSDCDLSGSDLSGSNLSGCDLSGSDLSGSNLSDCDLSGAATSLGITIDPLLPQRIIDAIDADPSSWNQESWHSHCNTRHCIAGFATHLSGPLGKYLDHNLGTSTAATLLLWTPDCVMPSFAGDASTAETLDRLRVMAEKASAAK